MLVDGERLWRFSVKTGCEHHEGHEPEDYQGSNKFTAEHIAVIKEFLDRPSVKTRDLASDLRKRFTGIVFTQRQLRNRRHRLNKKLLRGYKPFQAVMKMLDERNIPYQTKFQDDDADLLKPEGLFWTTPWCSEQWAQYPWVQLYDNTYRTNNKNLAFFQIVGLNHLGMAFSCGFGFINNERREGFDWLMEKVDWARKEAGAPAPGVTITDYDTAMRGAIAATYPNAQPQICIFHINKNVTLHIKKKWNKAAALAIAAEQGIQVPFSQEDDETNLDRVCQESVVDRDRRGVDGQPGRALDSVEYSMAGIYKLWEAVVYAPTLDDFTAAWEKLKAYFHQQTDILQYLEDTWMPVVEQWAGSYINKYLNFGQRTTSPVESVNRYLKSFIITGRSSVREAVLQSLEMVAAMEENIKQGIKAERNRLQYDYLGTDWLGSAPYNVSQKALGMVTKQYRMMLGAVPSRTRPSPTPLSDCTGSFMKQYGIPCSHDLFERHQLKKLSLVKEDFHPF